MNSSRQLTNRQLIYALIVALVASMLMSIASAIVAFVISTDKARETDEESNRKWCTLLVGIDTIYKQQPPTTGSAQQFANGIHQLVIDFECRRK